MVARRKIASKQDEGKKLQDGGVVGESGNVPSQMPSVMAKAPSAEAIAQRAQENAAKVALAKAQGESDGEAIGEAMGKAEQVARERAFEMAGKLNGDERQAYLDGIQIGAERKGLALGTARRLKYEFGAIFEACAVSVELTHTEKRRDEKGVSHQITTTDKWDKTKLQQVKSWPELVKRAREMRNKASTGAQDKNNTGQGERLVHMRDDVFEKIMADVMKRCTGAQALDLLEYGRQRVAFYYAKDSNNQPLCADELNNIKAATDSILQKVRKMHKKEEPQAVTVIEQKTGTNG